MSLGHLNLSYVEVVVVFFVPVSLEDAHSHVSVKLSNLQLYQRSEFSRPPHSHHDWEEKWGTMHGTASTLVQVNIRYQTWSLPSPWWLWTTLPGSSDAAGWQTSAGTPFLIPCKKTNKQAKKWKAKNTKILRKKPILLFLFCLKTQTWKYKSQNRVFSVLEVHKNTFFPPLQLL